MHNGTLKESSNILEISSHHIKFENGKEKAIKELFIPPKHGKKTRGDDYSNKDKYFVSGTIWTKLVFVNFLSKLYFVEMVQDLQD